MYRDPFQFWVYELSKAFGDRIDQGFDQNSLLNNLADHRIVEFI